MGLFEKRRARKFFIYVQDYEDNDPKSHEGLDLNKVTARELISSVSHPFYLSKACSSTYIDYKMNKNICIYTCRLNFLHKCSEHLPDSPACLLHEKGKYFSFDFFVTFGFFSLFFARKFVIRIFFSLLRKGVYFLEAHDH